MRQVAARLVYIPSAALSLAAGLSMLVVDIGLAWFTAALGLFLCATGCRSLAFVLLAKPYRSGRRTVWIMRLTHAFHLASGLFGLVAAFVYLPLPAALIAGVFVAIWIGIQVSALAATREFYTSTR